MKQGVLMNALHNQLPSVNPKCICYRDIEFFVLAIYLMKVISHQIFNTKISDGVQNLTGNTNQIWFNPPGQTIYGLEFVPSEFTEITLLLFFSVYVNLAELTSHNIKTLRDQNI